MALYSPSLICSLTCCMLRQGRCVPLVQVKALRLRQGNELLWHQCSLMLQGTHSGC